MVSAVVQVLRVARVERDIEGKAVQRKVPRRTDAPMGLNQAIILDRVPDTEFQAARLRRAGDNYQPGSCLLELETGAREPDQPVVDPGGHTYRGQEYIALPSGNL